MKLLMTSSADIIQECRVMFGVKSVSKSIFKRRRNVLPFTQGSFRAGTHRNAVPVLFGFRVSTMSTLVFC